MSGRKLSPIAAVACAFSFLLACPFISQQEFEDRKDLDQDGYAGTTRGGEDCDDSDPGVNPGAEEICDGLDQDCDEVTDEGLEGSEAWYQDIDEDGYGDPEGLTWICEGQDKTGLVQDDSDCLDTNAEVNPEAEEVCVDGLDNDCDGSWNSCVLEGDRDVQDADIRWAFDDIPSVTARGLGTSMAWRDASAGAAFMVGASDTSKGSVFFVTVEEEESGWEIVLQMTLNGAETGDALGVSLVALGGNTPSVMLGGNLVNGVDTGDYALGAAYRIPESALAESGGSRSVEDLAVATLFGSDNYVWMGQALSSAGDFFGPSGPDGIVDFMAAEPRAEADTVYAAGRVLLVRGDLEGDLNDQDASVVLMGETVDGLLGTSLSALGDIDGDGLEDFLVGEVGNLWYQGLAHVITGDLLSGLEDTILRASETDARIQGSVMGESLGIALAGPGDLDGDGLSDIATGAVPGPSGQGEVGLWFMSPAEGLSGEISSLDAAGRIEGDANGDEFGATITALPDMNGSGLSGLAVGAPGAAGGLENGKAYFFYGRSGEDWTGAVITSADLLVRAESYVGANLGTSLLAGRDVNGDGAMDLLLSAPEEELDEDGNNAGAIYLFFGNSL